VQDGVVDAGITGANLIAESRADVVTLLELGFGRCGLEAAVPAEAAPQTIEELSGLRIATTYPVSTRAALLERGVEAELVAYPREGHGNRERAHKIDAWTRTVAWFDRYVRGPA